jgi:cytoplasmic tRNA 2-thiolation protein 2
MTVAEDGAICKRCTTNPARLVVRSDPLCGDCFFKYVTGKVAKQLAASKLSILNVGHEPKLLLPISFGVCSISLIHILNGYLDAQLQKMDRTSFSIHILHVYQPGPDGEDPTMSNLESLKKRFPKLDFSTSHLSDVFIQASPQESRPQEESIKSDAVQRFNDFLGSTSSATSKSDVIGLLFTRAIVQFAKDHSYDGILWGDSTTRLAEKILSESAKGRGFSIPWQVTDGETPYGVSFYYPFREVLKKELISFVDMTEPPLTPLVAQDSLLETKAPVSSRNTTIDLLLKQYFESVEQSYPSIVSNVVRTSNKLQPPLVGTKRCKLCTLPVTHNQLGISSWEGNQDTQNGGPHSHWGLCYGCSRSVTADAAALLP